MTENPKLIVFSGPPGVGKSSLSYRLAHELGLPILAKDQIKRTLRTSELAADPKRLAYDLMLETAEFFLQHGGSVILDAVFGTNNLRERLIKIADTNSADFYGIDCICRDRTLWESRFTNRPEMVPGWNPAGWTESLRVQAYYEDWFCPHLTLDAVDPFETNYQKLLAYVTQ